MVKFEYQDIRIEALTQMKRYDYRDANNVGKTRFDRNVVVVVQFWDFVIYDCLNDLALIKSTMDYFMHAFWKRSSKQGTKIALMTSLEHEDPIQKLMFTAKQKNNVYSLEVSLTVKGQQSACIYLSGQEVLMIDIALSKAIALLTPQTV